MTVHPIPPFFNEDSKILILGSFPSVKSREVGFFYGHPQNRFWRILAAVFEEDVPVTTEEKREMLQRNKIALWDVIASCEIVGSADSTIRKVKPNVLSVILKNSSIERIFLNGKTAEKYYRKYQEKSIMRTAITLPSSSPANAAISFEEIVAIWRDELT